MQAAELGLKNVDRVMAMLIPATTQRGQDYSRLAEMYQALLVKRNQAWAERIEPLLAEGRRPLVAVGTAHLLGPDGVAALLEARGYTVRRIQ